MRPLLGLSSAIDAFNAALGKVAAWLILAAVLISAGNAVVRKAMNTSSNAWLELQAYLFGAVFLLVAAWALQKGDHVRIDIVNAALPKRLRHWIDVLGHGLMLIPLCALMLYEGVPFAIASFQSNEASSNAGGLPLWPAKFLIVAGFFVLLLQAISELIKRLGILNGALPDPLEKPSEENVAANMILKDEPRP